MSEHPTSSKTWPVKLVKGGIICQWEHLQMPCLIRENSTCQGLSVATEPWLTEQLAKQFVSLETGPHSTKNGFRSKGLEGSLILKRARTPATDGTSYRIMPSFRGMCALDGPSTAQLIWVWVTNSVPNNGHIQYLAIPK